MTATILEYHFDNVSDASTYAHMGSKVVIEYSIRKTAQNVKNIEALKKLPFFFFFQKFEVATYYRFDVKDTVLLISMK